MAGEAPKQKYRAKRTTVDGITFHSKREAERYKLLRSLERNGKISDLTLQPRFDLKCNGETLRIKSARYHKSGRPVTYIADFQYVICKTGETIIEDAKGHRTELYKLKRAIMAANGYTVTET